MLPGRTNEKVQLLILARLVDRPKKPITRPRLYKDIGAYVAPRLTAGEWNVMLDEALGALAAGGLIEQGPLRLTGAGRTRLEQLLGVTPLPSWTEIKGIHLPALGLDLSPASPQVRKRLRDAPGLRAGILRRHHRLRTREAPTLNQAVDALVWQLLDVDTDEPLTLNKLRAHMLRRLLGADARIPLERLEALAAAKALDLATTNAVALRPALIRQWLWAQPQSESPRAPADPNPAVDPVSDSDMDSAMDSASDPDSDIRALARRALAVAAGIEHTDQGRFDDRKVFVSAVWRRMRDEPACTGMDLEAFKAHLFEAHRRGLLVLHRADLVGAMDPAAVAASEIRYLNATFHFIEAMVSRRGGGHERDDTRADVRTDD
jgi:hypothetical protein